MRKGDVAIVDARAHISMVDGLKIGGAKVAFFAHNDAHALDEVLAATKGTRRLIFVDGLYSMDGDLADLPALAGCRRKPRRRAVRRRGALDPLLRPNRRRRGRTLRRAGAGRRAVRHAVEGVLRARRLCRHVHGPGRVLAVLRQLVWLHLCAAAVGRRRRLGRDRRHADRNLAARPALGERRLFQDATAVTRDQHRRIDQLRGADRRGRRPGVALRAGPPAARPWAVRDAGGLPDRRRSTRPGFARVSRPCTRARCWTRRCRSSRTCSCRRCAPRACWHARTV